jgi:hypothetical protein
MKKVTILAAILISLICAGALFAADEINPYKVKAVLLAIQQQADAMQANEAYATSAEDAQIDLIDIKGTYSGIAKGMSPNGSCITSGVKLVITKQCKTFAKGTLTALGVTVPVMGTFKYNSLSLSGTKTGTTVWFTGLTAQYITGKFLVSSFYIAKENSTVYNRYDGGWYLNKK